MSNKEFVFNIFSICPNTLIALTGISGIIDYKENKGISKLTKIFIFASRLILLGLIIVEILVKMFSYMTPNIISLIVVLIGILIKKVKI